MVDKQQRGEPIGMGTIFEGLSAFFPSFVATLIACLAAFLGFLLLVCRGSLSSSGWGYALWFVALRQPGRRRCARLVVALRQGALGPGHRHRVIGLVMNGAGSMVFFGSLFTVPFSLILSTLAFKDLGG